MLNIIYCSKEIKWQLTNHVHLLLKFFMFYSQFDSQSIESKRKEVSLFYCQSINQNVEN